MKAEKNRLMLVLILVIVILLGIVVYFFAVSPAISGYTIRAQNQGIQYTIGVIAQQAVTCQTVSLPVGNQTLDLIWVGCPVIQQCLQPQQPAS